MDDLARTRFRVGAICKGAELHSVVGGVFRLQWRDAHVGEGIGDTIAQLLGVFQLGKRAELQGVIERRTNRLQWPRAVDDVDAN